MKAVPGDLFPSPINRLLRCLSASGFFEKSLLIGSWVMPLYQELYNAAYALRTGDIDFAVHVVHRKKKMRADLERVLTDLGFTDFFTADGVQKFTASGYEVEFITHRPGGKQIGSKSVREWNISALPLPFINVLFSFPQAVLYESDTIRFPVPEAFFIHKLIVAQRRKTSAKKQKDLEQCAVLSSVLSNRMLNDVLQSQRFSKKTLRDMAQSCEEISFPLPGSEF